MGRRLRVPTVIGVLAALAALALPACGGDDNKLAKAGGYCDQLLAWNGAIATEEDPAEDATEAEAAALYKTRFSGYDTVLTKLAEVAPSSAKEALAALKLEASKAASSGDTGYFTNEDPTDTRALRNLYAANGAAYDGCGYTQLDMKWTDYKFEGAPAKVKAGRVGIQIKNTSTKEFHEMSIFRFNDGVTDSAATVLALEDREAQQAKVTDVPTVVFAPPAGTFDGSASTIVDLKAGRYALVCHIPTGATIENQFNPGEDAKAHWQDGMLHEFTVA
jgi:uncharacterized cupredoxin-like copper-binding protein